MNLFRSVTEVPKEVNW